MPNKSNHQIAVEKFLNGSNDAANHDFPAQNTSWLAGVVFAMLPFLDKRPRYRIPFVTTLEKRMMLNPEWLEAKYELKITRDGRIGVLREREIVELNDTGWIITPTLPTRGNVIDFQGSLVPIAPYKYLAPLK